MPKTHLDKLRDKPKEESQGKSQGSPFSAETDEKRDYIKISADYLADIIEDKVDLSQEGVGTKIKTAELLLKAGELLKNRGYDGRTVVFEGEADIED